MNDVIKSINVGGIEYDIQAKELTKVTYAELKELRDNGGLVAGHLYRITDYEFTTVTAGSKSAGHVFDIIALALSENELSHQARATHHEGDDYFVNNDLGAWELWYDLDNDTDKYEWADTANGKGVIYRMIDEFENDCPYDFKNLIVYSRANLSSTDDYYYYTFSLVYSRIDYDISTRVPSGVIQYRAEFNKIEPYYVSGKYKLGFNIFQLGTTVTNETISLNDLSKNCYNNIIKGSNNVLGAGCNNNGIVGNYNILYSGCVDCDIEGRYNKIGDNCRKIIISSSYNNIGRRCNNVQLSGSPYIYTVVGQECYDIDLSNCGSLIMNSFIHIGDFCTNVKCIYAGGYDYTYNIDIETGCNNVTIYEGTKNTTYKADGTVISRKDEYFDDGSGRLVPVKHPDLSTQPSILPYKFAGNYVYEQLIPKSALPYGILEASTLSVPHDKILILDISPVNNGSNRTKIYGLSSYVNDTDGVVYYKLLATGQPATDFDDPYLRVVYTSMPDENGGYYLYGEYVSEQPSLPRIQLISVANYIGDKAPILYNGETELTAQRDNNGNWYIEMPFDYRRINCSLFISPNIQDNETPYLYRDYLQYPGFKVVNGMAGHTFIIPLPEELMEVVVGSNVIRLDYNVMTDNLSEKGKLGLLVNTRNIGGIAAISLYNSVTGNESSLRPYQQVFWRYNGNYDIDSSLMLKFYDSNHNLITTIDGITVSGGASLKELGDMDYLSDKGVWAFSVSEYNYAFLYLSLQ